MLEHDKDKIKFFFVTVDPVRDTTDTLKKYLGDFDERIIGISGKKEQIHSFLNFMHVYHKKVFFDDENFTFDHSSQLFLFERKGKFYGTISLEESDEIALKKIKSII